LQFNENFQLVGAVVRTYLLEKSRGIHLEIEYIYIYIYIWWCIFVPQCSIDAWPGRTQLPYFLPIAGRAWNHSKQNWTSRDPGIRISVSVVFFPLGYIYIYIYIYIYKWSAYLMGWSFHFQFFPFKRVESRYSIYIYIYITLGGCTTLFHECLKKTFNGFISSWYQIYPRGDVCYDEHIYIYIFIIKNRLYYPCLVLVAVKWQSLHHHPPPPITSRFHPPITSRHWMMLRSLRAREQVSRLWAFARQTRCKRYIYIYIYIYRTTGLAMIYIYIYKCTTLEDDDTNPCIVLI
jgi:hypothetical protein